MKLTNEQIEAITEEANSKEAIKLYEPNIIHHLPVYDKMVMRVLYAYEKMRKGERNVEA